MLSWPIFWQFCIVSIHSFELKTTPVDSWEPVQPSRRSSRSRHRHRDIRGYRAYGEAEEHNLKHVGSWNDRFPVQLPVSPSLSGRAKL